MKKLLVIILIICLCPVCMVKAIDKSKVREAVEHQVKLFPDITLQDLYKNFFQDRFGPEHLATDADTVTKYINEELANNDKFAGPQYDPTGYLGNYVRVNLSEIKNGKLTTEDLVSAFINSAKPTGYSLEKWKKEWSQISEIIKSMNLNLPDFDATSKKISDLFADGKYVMHHSDSFDKYNYHYRLISKDAFGNLFFKSHKQEIMEQIKDQFPGLQIENE